MSKSFDVNRREFLQMSGMVGVIGASQSLFPRWMPQLAFRSPERMAAGRGDVLVNIFLRGGMDGLSVVAPFTEGANYYDVRPTIAVPEPGRANGAIDLDGRFGLHPTLAPLKEIYDQQHLAIVHATGSIDPSRSHFDAMTFMEAGVPGNKTLNTGWIGRHLQAAAWQNDSPFRAVGMGAMIPSALRGPITPLSIRSIADFHFRGREDELQRLQQAISSLYTIQAPTNQLERQAGLVFKTIATLDQLQATDYQPANGAQYPDDEFGLGLKQVAQLIKADVGLEVACVDLGGRRIIKKKRTRAGEFNNILTTLSNGLAAFYHDLRDYMAGVTVVTMSEFGRRAHENGSQGTDHGHGNVMFLMGGGVNGGQVHARWPGLAPEALDDGDLAITTDYRDVLAEVVSRRLRNPALDQIFPGHTPAAVDIVQARG